jgi:hypothetical protein
MKNYTRAAFLSRIVTVVGVGTLLGLGACANKNEGGTGTGSTKKKKKSSDDIEDVVIPAGLSLQEIRLAVVAAASNYGPTYDRVVKEAPPNAGTLVFIGPKSQERSPWQASITRDGIRVSKTLRGTWGVRSIGFEYVIGESAITHRFDRDGKMAGQTARHITALDDAIADNLKALAAAKDAGEKK